MISLLKSSPIDNEAIGLTVSIDNSVFKNRTEVRRGNLILFMIIGRGTEC